MLQDVVCLGGLASWRFELKKVLILFTTKAIYMPMMESFMEAQ